MEEVAPGVFRFRDTCNVYVLRAGREAVLIDFGTGAVLDHLAGLDVDRATDVLVTHHHRDQVQGLAHAVEAGIRIWVPPAERELVERMNRRWQTRQIDNDYDLRQDRFSLLEQVPVTGDVAEYRTRRYGGHAVYALPSPGHTLGSVSYLVEVEGRRLAFTGDLLYGDGKVWSLAATQWTYGGVEGQAATFTSCGLLAERAPDLLLPSHGEPIAEPQAALGLVRSRIKELVELRSEARWDLEDWQRHPWAQVTPHLLRNRTTFASSYALLSGSGAALLIDFGYDVTTGLSPVTERLARRPLLWSLDALRRDHGVERIEVVLPTHYHDDHVAGFNLLRDVEGTKVWAAESVAEILRDPRRHDLPCLWFEPIEVDRVLAPRESVRWREYELTCHPQPGHTLYAVAVAFEVDGRRVLAVGDQQAPFGREGGRDILNYQYRNRFRIDDYVHSAELYLSLRPDVLVSGHWLPVEVAEGYLEALLEDGRRVAELHRELLPLAEVDFGAEGFGARIEPYRATVAAGEDLALDVSVRNPFDRPETAVVRLVVPDGWRSDPESSVVPLGARADGSVIFTVTPDAPARRARVGADLTVGGVPFGQQAEALVDVA